MSRYANTPTLLQNETVESGAVALSIVLRYYGNYTPLEEVRYACAVAHEGSNLDNIIKAAQFYGLDVERRQGGIAELRRLSVPQIVPWKSDRFVVLEGFERRGVSINDPADGRQIVTRHDFESAYDGTTLVLKPSDAFQRVGQPFEVRESLREHLHGTRSAFVYLLLVSLFLLVPGILLPSFLRIFVDDILIAGRNWIAGLLLGMGIAAVFAAFLTWLQRMALLRLEVHVAAQASAELIWRVLRLPIAIVSQRSGGDFVSRIEAGERVTRLIFGTPAVVIVNLLLSVVFALVMLQYSVILTVISILFSVFSLVTFRFMARRQHDSARAMLHERGKLAAALMDGLRVLESFKAGASESLLFVRWTNLHMRAVSAEQELGYANNLLTAVSVFLIAMNAAILLIGGGALVIQGTLSIGMLVAFQSLLISFSLPFGQLLSLSGRLQEAEGDLQRMEAVFANAPSAAADETDDPGVLSGQLNLRGVSFGYHPLQPPFISDLALTIQPGQRVALVGTPGSGKTTVARLIAGMYPAWQGEILFDGQERSVIPHAVISRSVAMVDQHITLFTGTVQENLTLWNEYAALTDLWRAAKDACVHETILRRPDGYNTLIEEDGHNFSGSERQCLEIARALVSNPTLLILDEATSALDPITEAQVLENLGWRGCACLIISQRLAPVREFDEILVMEAGAIIERGTHAELMELGGLYARMFDAETRVSEATNSRYSQLIPAWVRIADSRVSAVESAVAPPPHPLPDSALGGMSLLRFGLRGARGAVVVLVLTGLIGGLLALALPLLTAAVIETVLPNGNLALLQRFGLVLALTALGLALFQLIRGTAALRVQARLDTELAPAIWDRLLRLPAAFFRPFTAGDLADRALAIDAVKWTIADLVALSPLTALFSTVSLALLLYYDVPMALAAAALIAGSVLLSAGLGGLGLRSERLRAELKGETSGLVLQMLNGVMRLRAAGADDRALGIWAQLFGWQQRLRYKAQRAQSLARMFVAAYPILASMVVFALMYARNTLTLGEFIGFYLAFTQLNVAVANFSLALITLRHAAPTFARLQPLLQAAPEVEAGMRAPETLSGAITVRNVSFRYGDDLPLAVSDVSFRVEPGEFVAIVGASGAGKSTLVRLLLGFEKPGAGEIFYDDQPFSMLNAQELRRRIAAVPDGLQVIEGNVGNIIGGIYDVSDDDIWRAARLAGIAGDIRRMPMGLRTFVGRDGGALTTGQRQRLLIARALATRPNILLLDDPAHGLDDHAQAQLMNTLRRVDATRIILTSRLSTTVAADRVLVIDAGRIVETGTYASLIGAGGRFTALAQMQLR